MFVERLEVHHAPGMPRGLVLKELAQGLVLLVGPNASGKSTTGRVLRGMLWPGDLDGEHRANATWRLATGGPVVGAALQYGGCAWDDDSLKPRDELCAAWNLSLRDLLRVDSSSDQGIARAIQTELDGGYDLRELDDGGGAVRPHWSIRKPYDRASEDLRTLLAQMDELAEAEAELPGLEKRALEAAGAPDRLVAVRAARDRRELLASIAERRVVLESLPQTLEQVPGDAAKTAERHREHVRKRTTEVEDRHRDVDEAVRTRDDFAFPEEVPSKVQIDSWSQRADTLVKVEEEVRRSRKERDAAAGRCRELAAQVWADPDSSQLPSRESLETFQGCVDGLAATRTALDALPATTTEPPETLSDEARTKVVEARQRLRDWLTEPREMVVAAPPVRRTGLALSLAVLGVVAVLVAVAVALLVHTVAGLALAVIGSGLLGLGIGLWIGTASATATEESPKSGLQDLADRYAKTGQPAPDAWTVEGVGRRLDELERQLRDDDSARDRAREQAELQRRRASLVESVQDKEAALREASASFGLDPGLGALALSAQANRIVALAEARKDLSEADNVLSKGSQRLRLALEELWSEVRTLGLTDLPRGETAEEVRVAIAYVAERRRGFVEACADVVRATAELQRSKEHLGDARREFAEHLTACGISEDEIDRLPELERQRAECIELRDEIASDERDLRKLEASVPEDLKGPDLDLDAEERRLIELEGELKETHSRIADIRSKIADRTQGRSVQEALAQKEQAQDDLADHRDAQQLAVARHALVGWLRNHRATADAPALLQRAKHWFLTFTRNRYVLEVDRDGGFRARDTRTQQLQGLKELSDGTRIQLLLAARLSFIEHTESGDSPVPLFLDEALSTTDPERFAMVGRAILELAASGRQVFYATSSPGEVAAWKSLAAEEGFEPPQVRRLGVDGTDADWDPAPAGLTLAPEVPEPAGLDPVAYTAALGLPRPELHTPAGSWPLSLVLHDDLESAAEAARSGIVYVSQLDLADHGVPLPLDGRRLAVARARGRAIEAALNGVRVGRGRAVAWEAVEESGAVSSTFAGRVQDLIDEHRSDARDFVDAVASLPRFRSANVDDLERHLEDLGVLDSREVLSAEAVVELAQKACRDAFKDGSLSLGEIDRLVRFVGEVVRVDL